MNTFLSCNTPEKQTELIRQWAIDLGFQCVGITAAQDQEDVGIHLREWLHRGYGGTMNWIARRTEERIHIQEYFPEVRSVIVVGMNYFPGVAPTDPNVGAVSNYAWGGDYHDLLKSRLHQLLQLIQEHVPQVKSRICVDTSPVLEKAWAQQAGLGWIGKHTNLITRSHGSWLFLGELMLDLELQADSPFLQDHCGSCTRCLDACPTQALVAPYILDARKCISYLTIEHRETLPENHCKAMGNWIYGCDICQQVCPWNNQSQKITEEEIFHDQRGISNRPLENWQSVTESQFSILFKGSAVKRVKSEQFQRNIRNALRNSAKSEG